MSTPPHQPGRSSDPVVKKHVKFMAVHYVEVHRPRALAQLQAYAAIEPFARRAAVVGGGHLPDGVTLHDHQRRIPVPPNAFPDALPQCSERLGSLAPHLAAAETFERLHSMIRRATSGEFDIRGIGDLSVYDFAQRLGHPRLLPQEVYLHTGAAVGARHLATVMGRDPWEGTIPMKELPKVWQKRLDAADVEDVLCHFKDALRQLAEHRVPVYGKSCGCPGGPAANGYDVP
ncbi:hypothetical protein ACIQ62_15095 [Streptomyces sp. NPDC096319]|uniref:hypothetical protein n=1 Tax=Streptomyces sp. NPDC096319 TaxID=3366084 RepID=UPI0037F452A2